MIILSIRLFFSTARRTNQEAPPQLSGACLYSNPPLLLSLRVFLTPPSFGHLPYILRCKTQGRRVNSITPLLVFLTPLLVATLLSSPLYFLAPHPAMLRGTAGEEGEGNPPLIAVRYFVYGVRQGRIVIQRTFFPSQRKSLLH